MNNDAFSFSKNRASRSWCRIIAFSVFSAFLFLPFASLSSAWAGSGSFVADSDMARVSYSVSGASLGTPEDSKNERRGNFQYFRSYEGDLTGSTLRISGTASTEASNEQSSLSVSVSAGGKSDSYSTSFESGTAENFSVSIPVPQGATSGSFSIRVTRAVYFSTIGETRYDGVTVSGSFSADAEENRPPTVSLDYSPADPVEGEPVDFTATASDPDGDPLTYEWYLNGNKQPADSSSVTWEEPSEGRHTIRVVVSDGRGGTDEDSVTFEVGEKEDIAVGVSYRLGYEFPTDAERVMPLLLTFRVEEGPPGTYISEIIRITQGTRDAEVFHSGECFGPANPILDQPTTWECGYEGISWPDVLAIAKSQNPVVPFEARVEVFAGYDGSEMVFETVDLEFDVRLDGIASVMLLPPYADNTERERYSTADAELLDEGGNYMQTDNPLPLGQWEVVKPGQRIRVYQQTQAMVRCLSGMIWLIHRELGPVRSWDYVIGAEGTANLSNFPVPANKSYVEHAVETLYDETIKGPAKKKVVTRLLGVGKTAAGRSLGVLGFVMNETPAGNHEVYAVRMRSEMTIDFHADGSITARTLKGEPDLIGTDGTEVPLHAGYETTMAEGTGGFSTPVPHAYDDAEELLPVPREFTSGDSGAGEENGDSGSSGSSSSGGCFIGMLKHLK